MKGKVEGNRTSLNRSLFSALVLARKAVTCKHVMQHRATDPYMHLICQELL